MMCRRSKQKEAILRVIRNATCHPDAGWIYEQVRLEIPRISLGTVYRNLKALESGGQIRRLEIDMQSHYEKTGDKHSHFRCDRCGTIRDVYLSFDTELDQEVSDDIGCCVTRHYLEFVGHCQDCES